MYKAIFLSFLFISFTVHSQNNYIKKYNYKLSLKELNKDQITVKLNYTGELADTATFFMPKIIPGIYDATNFGKFVSNMQAFDKENQPLQVLRLNENSWAIANSKTLEHLSYNIDDGWEEFDFEDLRPYRSAESSFSENAFVLSTPSIFGYFKNHKEDSIQVSITKPSLFYGASSLIKENVSDTLDVYQAKNYNYLVDNPILYSVPDTTRIILPNINVEIACFSTSNNKISKEVATHIKPLLENQTKYLGGTLPMKNYTFIIYNNLNPNRNSYFSEGLEHSKSTLVLMHLPDDIETIKETIYHTVSHEFFHTIMPLSLHSEEIHYYNYNDPKFSQHLWLYEGMTEYFTIHMPIKQKVQEIDVFIEVLEEKIRESKKFPSDLSIIDLSKNPIAYQDQYMNVYFKGTLINLCLDIKLRELSNGEYGVQEMINDLIEEYGPDKPFKDSTLFSEIVRITGYQELNQFFNDYVISNKPLPLVDYLHKVGFDLNLTESKISEIAKPDRSQTTLKKYWINQ